MEEKIRPNQSPRKLECFACSVYFHKRRKPNSINALSDPSRVRMQAQVRGKPHKVFKETPLYQKLGPYSVSR